MQCITALSLQPRTHSTVPAATDANTCTAQPPNTPNNASAVGSMLLFSTSSSMTNPQKANGYAQVYTQVRFKDGLGIGCLSENAGRHKAMLLKGCTTIMLAAGCGWSRSRCGASQLRRPPLQHRCGQLLLGTAGQHHKHTSASPMEEHMHCTGCAAHALIESWTQLSRQAYPAGFLRQPLPQPFASSSRHAHSRAQGRGASKSACTVQAQLLPVQAPYRQCRSQLASSAGRARSHA